MTRALRDIPAVRALAARDAFDLMQRVRSNRGMTSDHTEAAIYEGVLDLLCDLTRPASRDAVLRLVAERIWPDRTVTALRFLRCHPDSWYVSAVVGGYEGEQVRRLSRYDGHDEAEAIALTADAVLT